MPDKFIFTYNYNEPLHVHRLRRRNGSCRQLRVTPPQQPILFKVPQTLLVLACFRLLLPICYDRQLGYFPARTVTATSSSGTAVAAHLLFVWFRRRVLYLPSP